MGEMKGFPNQVSDLRKLADGLAAIQRLNDRGLDSKNYDVLGEALVRAAVLGTGHVPKPVAQYLREQRAKPTQSQSHQTGARGLREQYRLLGLIDDSGDAVQLTESGRRTAGFAGLPLDEHKREHWRRLIRNISHAGRDGVHSHPYQILLRLVERKPGITRAKCALALEARDDSEGELTRIVLLADLDETAIRAEIGETQSNWDNAKKILPKFAEQLGDVVKVGQCFYLATGPGEGGPSATAPLAAPANRRTRLSRSVTPDSIAQVATADSFDEVDLPVGEVDAAAMREAVRQRLDRLRRHNLLVREVAQRYATGGLALYEGRYDCLASGRLVDFLNEIKTLDGTVADEERQVRDALGQLLYYEPFVRRETGGGIIHKVAVFESAISAEHIQLLHDLGIIAIWKDGGSFRGGSGADEVLGRYFDDLA